MATNARTEVARTKKPLATCVFRVQGVHKARMRQSVFAAQRKNLVNGLRIWNSLRMFSGGSVVLAIFPHLQAVSPTCLLPCQRIPRHRSDWQSCQSWKEIET